LAPQPAQSLPEAPGVAIDGGTKLGASHRRRSGNVALLGGFGFVMKVTHAEVRPLCDDDLFEAQICAAYDLPRTTRSFYVGQLGWIVDVILLFKHKGTHLIRLRSHRRCPEKRRRRWKR
jgi:hypothetical protein